MKLTVPYSLAVQENGLRRKERVSEYENWCLLFLWNNAVFVLTMLFRSFHMWCSVAFSKICPAGIGYYIHDSRETLSVSPSLSFIIPDGNKEGVSLNAALTITTVLTGHIHLFH